MIFIPESPRWLILQGKFEKGRKSLEWLRPKGSPIDEEAATIKAAIDKVREMGGKVGVIDMFKNPIDRRRTFLSVSAVTLQAASGSMFIIGKCPPMPPKAHPFSSWAMSQPDIVQRCLD